jgi:hypothetical protein
VKKEIMKENLYFLFKRIHKNNMNSKFNIESKIPRVGIFWYIEGEIISYDKAWKELLPSKDGEEEHYDIKESHYNFWDRLKRYKPELKYDEYEDYPRGRVVALKKNGVLSFKVIASFDLINNPKFKKAIDKEYNLPFNTEWIADTHYENPNEINWDIL